MAQSLARIYAHIIFSTKNRVGLLQDPRARKEMHAYLASIFRAYECPALDVGGTADHVHVLCTLSKTETLAELIGEVKRSSSKWIKTKGRAYARFQWQNGYGAFSVSYSNVRRVRDYIGRQEEHHRKTAFQDEFRRFLRKHGIEFDEQYVWD